MWAAPQPEPIAESFPTENNSEIPTSLSVVIALSRLLSELPSSEFAPFPEAFENLRS